MFLKYSKEIWKKIERNIFDKTTNVMRVHWNLSVLLYLKTDWTFQSEKFLS